MGVAALGFRKRERAETAVLPLHEHLLGIRHSFLLRFILLEDAPAGDRFRHLDPVGVAAAPILERADADATMLPRGCLLAFPLGLFWLLNIRAFHASTIGETIS